MEGMQEVQRIARVAALRYARRVYSVPVEEMESEALVAVLQAKKNYDARVGVPFGAYAYRSAVNAIRPFLWRSISPVSAPYRSLSQMRDLRGVEVDPSVREDSPPPDERLDEARWKERVWQRLLQLDRSKGLAIEVLLYGLSSKEVAEKHGVPVNQVYQATFSMRRKMSKDYPLWKLWRKG